VGEEEAPFRDLQWSPTMKETFLAPSLMEESFLSISHAVLLQPFLEVVEHL